MQSSISLIPSKGRLYAKNNNHKTEQYHKYTCICRNKHTVCTCTFKLCVFIYIHVYLSSRASTIVSCNPIFAAGDLKLRNRVFSLNI